MAKGNNIKSGKKPLTDRQKKKRLDSFLIDDPDSYSIDYCWRAFLINREIRGNSKASLEAYKRFYKKFCSMFSVLENGARELGLMLKNRTALKLF